ncbi:MAG TPA: enolase C-terminal domain-like protein [Verrucomicrobiae bacterium]|nr:enolase C-terminal domain-like protein [Verrucomicrobiae bacterium]
MSETIDQCEVTAFKVPTDSPESDGTLEWDSTTLVLVHLRAGKFGGIGYTYSHESCVPLIKEKLFSFVRGADPTAIPEIYGKMNGAMRNFGRRGLASSAIAAIDIALWDLKARMFGLPLVKLIGAVREKIPAYGSGGFTSYSDQQLCRQFEKWVEEDFSMVKMKVGRRPEMDASRVAIARSCIADGTQLFVDANGAYSTKQALAFAQIFSEHNVSWFEEPVSSDDWHGLRFVREHLPPGMEVSAGEYDYDCIQARQKLEIGAVDVLQSDATRCGITGFLQASDLCNAFEMPLSSHTAPAVHAHLCCVAPRARHAEYFHDHVRIEQLFFDGATVKHKNGFLQPDLSQPGLGLEFKKRNAVKFQI